MRAEGAIERRDATDNEIVLDVLNAVERDPIVTAWRSACRRALAPAVAYGIFADAKGVLERIADCRRVGRKMGFFVRAGSVGTI
jgi:hypothetical protein